MEKINKEGKIDVGRVYLTYDQLNGEKKRKNKWWDGATNVDIKPIVYDAKVKIYSKKLTKKSGVKYQLILYKKSRSLNLDSQEKKLRSNRKMTEEELQHQREIHLYEVRRKLRDYALNNDFDYFWTLTFDPKLCGKSNDLRFEDMRKWLEKERKKAKYYGEDFRYIFIPELHHGKGKNSGTIHWHGLTGGYAPKLVDSGHEYQHVKVLNCPDWKFGFTNVQRVRSQVKVANYIQKYMTKDLINSPVRAHKKKYWSSKNLKLPEEYYIKDMVDLSDWEPDFDCDVCSIYNLTNHDIEKIQRKNN